MTKKITIKSISNLIAAVPHILGFHVTNSFVVVTLGGGMTARIDHPRNGTDILEAAVALGSAYHRNPGRVALLSFTADTVEAEGVLTCLGAILEDVCTVEARVHITPDGAWHDHHTGTRGRVAETDRSMIAAEFIAEGVRAPLANREDVTAGLIGSGDAVAGLVSEYEATGSTEWVSTENDWARSRIGCFHVDQERFSDHDAARLLVAVGSTEVLVEVVAALDKTTATADMALWSDLTKRAPGDLRTPAALLLAVAAWLGGNGALARTAHEVANSPDHVIAQVVDRVLNNAVRPTQNIAELLATA